MTLDPRVPVALSLVDGLDAALGAGLARLVPEQRAALGAFANALAGSPLGGSVAHAVEALSGGDPGAHHLVAVAAGRAALFGAVHDALLEGLGTPLAPAEPPASATPNAEQRPRLDGLRQWLVEIALAGFGQLDAATIAPIFPTLTTLQTTEGLSRLSALATGFARELLDHAPTSALPSLPLRRWADLWTRALLGTVTLPEAPVTTQVSGRLSVLGADVRHHDHLVSVVAHGVFEGSDGSRRFVRTTVSSWKVDAIAGADAWNLLKPQAPVLVAALGAPAVLTLPSATLASNGDLATGPVADSTPFDPFGLDLSGVTYCAPTPRDRHPVHVAVPARDADVPLDFSRSSALLDLRDAAGEAASILGLVRWDDGWRFQPMAVRTKKGKVFNAATSLAAADKVKADARAVLAERASKLLRA